MRRRGCRLVGDRLGRSLQELVGILRELREREVDLYLHQQGLDTATPSGRALYQTLGMFAELERAIIREHIKAGHTRARAQGKRLSRPKTPLEIQSGSVNCGQSATASGASPRRWVCVEEYGGELCQSVLNKMLMLNMSP